MTIDSDDRRLLSELDRNSRSSFTEIAKRLHSSPQKVKYRFERMITEGVITALWPMIDFRKIGYTNVAYFFKLKNLTNETEQKLSEYLKKANEINIAMRGDGFWDLHIAISTPGIFSNQRIFELFYETFHDNIADYQTAVPVGFYEFPRKYLGNVKEPEKQPLTGYDVEKVELSDIQRRVLEKLNISSRTTYNDLANQLAVSRQAAVKNHLKLEQEGVIQSYAIWIDHQKLGYSLYRTLFRLKNFDQARYQELFQFCQKHPNIIHFLKLIGDWQLLLDIEIESSRQLRELKRELQNKFSDMIDSIEPTLVYGIQKFRDVPLKLQ